MNVGKVPQSKTIYNELSLETFKKLLIQNNKIILIKFGATWCGPCKKIKTVCHNYITKMPENVLCFDLDVDDNFDIFANLKAKKMVTGIPVLLGFYCKSDKDMAHWYIPDVSISGTDTAQINNFFKEIYTHAS